MSFYAKWGCRCCGVIIVDQKPFKTHDEALAGCAKLEDDHVPVCPQWPEENGKKLLWTELCTFCHERRGTIEHQGSERKICRECQSQIDKICLTAG